MEKEKFKLLFYLKRGTQDKNGKSPIMGRISAGRSMVQFSCKCSCTPRLWDSRKNRLLGKSAEAVSVNKELDRLQVSWKIQCKLPPKTKRFCPLVLK